MWLFSLFFALFFFYLGSCFYKSSLCSCLPLQSLSQPNASYSCLSRSSAASHGRQPMCSQCGAAPTQRQEASITCGTAPGWSVGACGGRPPEKDKKDRAAFVEEQNNDNNNNHNLDTSFPAIRAASPARLSSGCSVAATMRRTSPDKGGD